MSLLPKDVARIAHLARLALPAAEQEAVTGDLNRILGLIEQLQAVDTAGVEPMASPAPMALPLRPDQVTDGGIADRVLSNAPEAVHGYFVVPKVVE